MKFRVEWNDCDGVRHDDEVSARSRWFARQAIIQQEKPFKVTILHIRKVS